RRETVHIGEQLRQFRRRLGITTREVEEYSRKVADSEGNEEYYISNAWITQLENKTSVPSIYKLYSLSVIYRIRFTDLLMIYGVDLAKLQITLEESYAREEQNNAEVEVQTAEQLITFPVSFDSGFRPKQTTVVSRIQEIWGELPITMLQYLDFKNTSYGYIGL